MKFRKKDYIGFFILFLFIVAFNFVKPLSAYSITKGLLMVFILSLVLGTLSNLISMLFSKLR